MRPRPRNWRATFAGLGVGLAVGLAFFLAGIGGWVLTFAALAAALVWARFYVRTWGSEDLRRRLDDPRGRRRDDET